LERKLTYLKKNLDKYRSLNDKELAHFSKLSAEGSSALPLNFVFRKAVDKYIYSKTSSCIAIWRNFVRLHRAYEVEMGFKGTQAIIMQRCGRSYLAKNIMKGMIVRKKKKKILCAMFIQRCWRKKKQVSERSGGGGVEEGESYEPLLN